VQTAEESDTDADARERARKRERERERVYLPQKLEERYKVIANM